MHFSQIKKALIFLILSVGLVSCATSAYRMAELSVGMDRSQIIKILGTPNETQGKENTEVLRYLLVTDRNISKCIFLTILTFGIGVEPACQFDKSPYFVRLVDGRIAEYGPGFGFKNQGVLEPENNNVE